ncbi:N-acetyltransferase [Bradyrhizobium sp. cir1]|uniref:N-acetyltransferase n=1 Tax=Bradyrhizobium sp. cir1 TaxID=1445730 RepID=UPI00160586F2|nr:N-acetyltransferase [Bradyrhizobium sp. cir1]
MRRRSERGEQGHDAERDTHFPDISPAATSLGRTLASTGLVKGALDLIRRDGRKLIAGCGFVVDYLDKHPEDADLVA